VSYHQRYFTQNPEDIIRENTGNFCIYNSSIEKNKFKESGHYQDYDDQTINDPAEITFKASGEKYKLILSNITGEKELKNSLYNLYGSKIS
jgi:hypothetical protein